LGEGEGREEESCLVLTEIIWPSFSLWVWGLFVFSGLAPDPPQKHWYIQPLSKSGAEKSVFDCEGGEEAVGEGEEAGEESCQLRPFEPKGEAASCASRLPENEHRLLFVAHGDDWIGVDGATDGQVARHERYDHKKCGNRGERRWVVWADVVKHVGHETRQP
jgi:hypothetical protein